MSRRNNLPDEVQEGVVYRDAEVRLRIATEIVDSYPNLWNSSDSDRVRKNMEHPSIGTVEEDPESTQKKEKK